MPLTRAQKLAIQHELQTARASEIALRYGISRSRVQQLKSSDPATWAPDRENAQPVNRTVLRFGSRGSHLNDELVQLAISESAETYVQLASRYKTTVYSIQRIQWHWNGHRGVGAVKGKAKRRSRPPETTEEKAARIERKRAYMREYEKRWRRENPEAAKEKSRKAYQRNALKHSTYMRSYYREHREWFKTRNAKWKRENPERVRQIAAKSRARRRERLNLTKSSDDVG